MGVTLEQLLESRDTRAQHQRDLLGKYPGRSLVSMTVQLPGNVKRSSLSLRIAGAGTEAVRMAFSPEYEELKDLDTGYEGFFVVPMAPLELKRLCCGIEDTHPLGRLLDLDVLASACDGVAVKGNVPASARVGVAMAEEKWFFGYRPEKYFSSAEGKADAVLFSREDIGLPPRKCLLCDRPARICMRERTHSTEELLQEIERIVNNYQP
jgi:holo-ACP synthase CitX